MIKSKTVIAIVFLFFTSCKSNHIHEKIDFENKINLNRNETLRIPSELRQKMDEDFFLMSPRPVDRTETQKTVFLSTLTRNYLPVDFWLVDKTGVLKSSSILFDGSGGGGRIDFSSHILNKKIGDFLLGFRLDPQFNHKNTRVYFLENFKTEDCYQFKDITRYFFRNIYKNGLITTTKDFINLKLLLGAYVFVANIDDSYYMGQIHLTDSRYTDFLCRDN